MSTPEMQRAEELLKTMTVEEKAMQLSSIFPLALFNSRYLEEKSSWQRNKLQKRKGKRSS